MAPQWFLPKTWYILIFSNGTVHRSHTHNLYSLYMIWITYNRGAQFILAKHITSFYGSVQYNGFTRMSCTVHMYITYFFRTIQSTTWSLCRWIGDPKIVAPKWFRLNITHNFVAKNRSLDHSHKSYSVYMNRLFYNRGAQAILPKHDISFCRTE